MLKPNFPILIILFVLLIISLGLVYTNLNRQIFQQFPSISPSPHLNFNTPPPTPSPITLPQSSPKITPTPKSDLTISEYSYPDSKIILNSPESLELESTDPSEKITDWYKQKVESLMFKAKSFVTTTTNGNILNKLSAANSSSKIEIEITKNENSSITKIKISFKKP